MANRKKVRADAELAESSNWGVPDWKERQSYLVAAKWQKLHPDKQRWEFLRRTKEYREDWVRSQVKISPLTKPISKFHVVRPFDGKALAAKYRMSHPVPPKDSYVKLPKGFHFIRPSLTGGDIVYPRVSVPFQEAKPVKEGWDAKLAASAEKTIPIMIPHDWYEMRVWVEFDLAHSLKDQITQAQANLIKAANQVDSFMEVLRRPDGKYEEGDYVPQKVRMKNKRGANKEARTPKEELPIIALLRVLDAKNCGRTNAQIAGFLSEEADRAIDSSTISKRYKIASQLWKAL